MDDIDLVLADHPRKAAGIAPDGVGVLARQRQFDVLGAGPLQLMHHRPALRRDDRNAACPLNCGRYIDRAALGPADDQPGQNLQHCDRPPVWVDKRNGGNSGVALHDSLATLRAGWRVPEAARAISRIAVRSPLSYSLDSEAEPEQD